MWAKQGLCTYRVGILGHTLQKKSATDLRLRLIDQSDVKCQELGIKFLFHLYHSKSYDCTGIWNANILITFYNDSVPRGH